MGASETYEMAPYVEKASRLELIIRWLYAIVIGILFYLWALYVSACNFLQFWHILIFGRRGARLYRATRRYLAALANVYSYLWYLTDDRPDLTPDLLVLFKKASLTMQPPASGGSFCVSCGVSIQPGAKFCGSCGAKQA